MKLNSVGLLLGGFIAFNEARSLSYRMKATENKACFYATVDKNVALANANLQFYYAASDAHGTETIYVDAVVLGPSGQQLTSQRHQTHSEINVKPPYFGEYSLCLTRSSSDKHPAKNIDTNFDVDITVPKGKSVVSSTEKEASVKLERTVGKLQGELGDLVHTIKYIKNRERRNLETVDSIENWIFYISLFEVILIIGMSAAQVTILRMFFTGSGKKQRP